MEGDGAERANEETSDAGSKSDPAIAPGADAVAAPPRKWAYRLTTADALAWESLPRELTGWRWFAFILFLASAGAWSAAAAEYVGVNDDGWGLLVMMLAAGALHWLIATIFMNWRMRVRARRRIPGPLDVEVEDHGDHVLIRTTPIGGATATRVVSFDLVRECFVDAGRLFLHDVSDVLIMPLAVFEDEADMRATAAAWDTRAAESED